MINLLLFLAGKFTTNFLYLSVTCLANKYVTFQVELIATCLAEKLAKNCWEIRYFLLKNSLLLWLRILVELFATYLAKKLATDLVELFATDLVEIFATFLAEKFATFSSWVSLYLFGWEVSHFLNYFSKTPLQWH